MPVVLGAAWLLGVVLAALLRASWWLLRVLWALTWRLAVVAAALLVVAFSRSLAWRLAAAGLGAALSGRVVRKGGRGDGGQRGQRTTPLVGAASAVRVRLKPVSAQRVVTTDYGTQRFFARGVTGPELLTMTCGFAGCGKTEVKLGIWRAQYDGRDFCGLPTVRGTHKLLLTEMNRKTLGPVLARWGFAERPRGWLHDKRLRYLPVRGGPGGYIDVLYAEEVLAPVVVDGETVTPDWPHVVEAVAPLAVKGDYDELCVDSLAEWMGDDSQGNMLTTLALCRQITRHGPAVDVLHHTPRSDPRRPRGSGAIEGKLDLGWSVYGLAASYAPRSLHDTVRVFAPFKSRFPDDCPREPLRIERVWAGPDSGTVPRYQLEGATPAAKNSPHDGASSNPDSHPDPTLTPNEDKVLAAMLTAGRGGATTTALAEATGLPRQRAHEAVTALVGRSLARVGGFQTPEGGGPKASLYVAVATPKSEMNSSQISQRPALRLVEPEEVA